jgi:hypothetical protein
MHKWMTVEKRSKPKLFWFGSCLFLDNTDLILSDTHQIEYQAHVLLTEINSLFKSYYWEVEIQFQGIFGPNFRPKPKNHQIFVLESSLPHCKRRFFTIGSWRIL